MGTFVDEVPQVPFEWGDEVYSGLGSDTTKDLVEQKVTSSLATADQMLTKLLGSDGNSGYLGNLNAIITDFSIPALPDFTVDIPTISVPSLSRPTPDLSGLDLDFPTFDTAPPSMLTIPTIDLSDLAPADLPDEVAAAVNWVDSVHDTTLYAQVLARIVADLQSGARGVDPTVEQEIYDRAAARQDLIDEKAEVETLQFFAARGWEIPPLAMSAKLQEVSNESARNRTELNGKILIEQADLAQKNSQFIIGAAKDLESVLREFTAKTADRSLDYAKAVAANAIALYTQRVNAYIAAAEANKAYVETQVENLKGVVEYNKGLVAAFASQAEAYNTIVEAKAKNNEAVTSVYESEVKGYAAETEAISAAGQLTVSEYQLKLQNGELMLRAAIAEVEAIVKAFEAESNLKEKVAADMASIASQTVASAYGSVNANIGLSHSTGRDQSESFNHSESRGVDYNLSQSLGESHLFDESAD